MHQPFNTLFQLSKTAVVSEIGDFSHHTSAFRIAPCDFQPWIFTELFQTQGYAVSLSIKLKNLDINFLSNFHDLGGVLDALPRHVGNVK